MKKEKLSYISLIDIHPKPSQKEYSNGKALEFPIDIKPTIKRFNHYYLGNDGKVYKLDRYMLCTKREIAEMMVQQRAKIGHAEEEDTTYDLGQPSTRTHLRTLYEIRGLVLEDSIDKRMKVYDALELRRDSIEIFLNNSQIRSAITNIENQTKQKTKIKKPKECLITLLETEVYR